MLSALFTIDCIHNRQAHGKRGQEKALRNSFHFEFRNVVWYCASGMKGKRNCKAKENRTHEPTRKPNNASRLFSCRGCNFFVRFWLAVVSRLRSQFGIDWRGSALARLRQLVYNAPFAVRNFTPNVWTIVSFFRICLCVLCVFGFFCCETAKLDFLGIQRQSLFKWLSNLSVWPNRSSARARIGSTQLIGRRIPCELSHCAHNLAFLALGPEQMPPSQAVQIAMLPKPDCRWVFSACSRNWKILGNS